MIVEFFVPGRPKAWQRVSTNKHGAKFVPNETAEWKKTIGWEAKKIGASMELGPVRLSLVFYLPGAKKNISKPHTVRPDLDNLIKSVKDGLKGICWKDDCQIFKVEAIKYVYPEKMGVLIKYQGGY